MNMKKEEKNIPIKCVVVGDSHVGKTSILTYLTQRKFLPISESTIGAAFSTYIVDKQVDEKWGMEKIPITLKIRFELWDTAGQERYRSIVPLYLRGAVVIFLVYDRSIKESYENAINFWYKFIDMNMDKTSMKPIPSNIFKRQIYLIENKVDLDNYYHLDVKAKRFCETNDVNFWQTSAKVGSGIHELFNDIADKIVLFTQKYDLRYVETLLASNYYLPVKVKDESSGLLEYEKPPEKKKCFPCT